LFKRFEAIWTPTVLLLDPEGRERLRVEGYLSKPEFAAHLGLGLARVAFMNKRGEEASAKYDEVVKLYPLTHAAAEAFYWAGVSRYRMTKDHQALDALGRDFKTRYPESIWALKASVWSES
jgi:outer membrane protein assembly factor BamD (BamD/ComL family)